MSSRHILYVVGIVLITVVWFLYANPTTQWNIKYQYWAKSCTYPEGEECRATEACVFTEPTKSICVEKDQDPTPEVLFPKSRNSRSICTQGPRTAAGRTHSYLNTSFAVDLSTPEQEPNAQILSVFDGKVVVHTGCDNQDDRKFNNDGCGYGFGNWVVIFDAKSNLMALNAHLRTVNVKDGDNVRIGDVIGEEGKTGAAGHRHLHFSIHRNIWRLTPELFKKYGIWLPPSVPWKTRIKDLSGEEKTVHVSDLPCEDNNDLTRPSFQGG